MDTSHPTTTPVTTVAPTTIGFEVENLAATPAAATPATIPTTAGIRSGSIGDGITPFCKIKTEKEKHIEVEPSSCLLE